MHVHKGIVEMRDPANIQKWYYEGGLVHIVIYKESCVFFIREAKEALKNRETLKILA